MKAIGKHKNVTSSVATIAIWYMISNLLVRGLNMLTTPLFTRLLSQSDYGEFSNFCSWESILFVLLSFQFHATIPRAKYDFPDEMDKYLSSIVFSSNVITLIFYGIVEMGRGYFESFFSMDIVYIRILFLYLFFSPTFTFMQMKHRIYNKYKLFVVLAIGSALIRTLVSLLAVLAMQNKLMARIIGYTVPITIINLIIWVIVFVQGKRISWQCTKYAFIMATPLLQNAIAANLLSTSDRVMIKQFCGPDQTAVYTVAYSCASVVSLIWTSMNQAWTPWLFDRLQEKKHTEIWEKSRIYFGCFVLMVIPIQLAIPELVYIMGGSSYYEARYIMPAIIIGCVYQFVYGLYVNIETFEKKNWLIVKGTTISAVINILLNFIFIPLFGYGVAAYTTLVGYLSLMLFHWRSVKKMKIYEGVYDEPLIFKVGIFLFISHFLFMALYQVIILRYILLLTYFFALFIICMKNRKKIMEMINMKH